MSVTVTRGVREWLARRAAPLLLGVTTAALVAGCCAWLAGDHQTAEAVWPGVAVISVMVASGRALEAWADYRARRDLSARLGRLIADIGDRAPDETDVADLRGTRYGLHAILRLHTVQEDEAYLSLDDEPETVGGRP